MWATFVPLAGVPALVRLLLTPKEKGVQHSTEYDQEIYVREGDFVQGQLLIARGCKGPSEVFIEENNIKSLEENVNLQGIALIKSQITSILPINK